MADQQVAVRAQQVAELRQHPGLGLVIEVDEHVAQEDHVEVAFRIVAAGQQVEVGKGDLARQLGFDPDLAGELVMAALKVAQPQMGRHVLGPLDRVDGAAGKGMTRVLMSVPWMLQRSLMPSCSASTMAAE